MHKLLAILIFSLPLGSAAADIYKRVLPDGTVVFSDQPGEDATKVESAPLQIYTAPPAPPAQTPAPATSPTDEGPAYSRLTIMAPEQDAVIWDNNGVVPVQVDIQPPLKTSQGHHLTLLMDGQKITDLTVPHYTLRGVDRGTHTLQVKAVDNGKVLAESRIVQFHLKRHIIRRPTPAN